AGASLALIILSPPLAALAIAVKRSSPGPVIYRQQRMGRRKREFTILKFRSMYADAEAASGPVLTQADDPRITSVGRFMRKYRLDELPQFWNVIRGEMSLVGPRPERRIFADQIAARVPVYSAIYQIRPGITSWGMVKYGYASTIDQMIERLRYDLIYLENISVATDLKILLHTVATVIGGRGK
ncbi:MAG: sugar transferase, partial [Muribaculaceae bacterium]|nr:sugar transferase [Muribaculaceae bacterium]